MQVDCHASLVSASRAAAHTHAEVKTPLGVARDRESTDSNVASSTPPLPAHLANLASIPFAPILRPTWAEFADSMAYIAAVSKKYSNTHGIVQIIPPAGWLPGSRLDFGGGAGSGGAQDDSSHHTPPAFDIRVQQVQKPDLQVLSRPHPRVSWSWMTKQAAALHRKWQQKKQANGDEDVEDVTGAQPARTITAADLAQQTSPAAAAAFSPAAADASASSNCPDAVRECMYESMRRIVLEYGTLDAERRREVESSARRAAHQDRPKSHASPSSTASVTTDSVTAATATVSKTAADSTLRAEYDYWKWMYGLGTSKTIYAHDVECRPEFRQLRPVRNAAAAGPCPFCLSASCRLVYPPSSWDLTSLAWLPRGLLRHLGGTAPGVTSPMAYAGAHHSTFAYHNEDHYLCSISFMHPASDAEAAGEHDALDLDQRSSLKVWYGVPGSASAAFERVLEQRILCGRSASALRMLPRKQTAFSPSLLVAHGVPVHKVLHVPNTFVVTFCQAYHSGFSESAGTNLTESVNFALPEWLVDAKSHPSHMWSAGCGLKAVQVYRSISTPAILPHAKMILTMADRIIDEFTRRYGDEHDAAHSAKGRKRTRTNSDTSIDSDRVHVQVDLRSPAGPGATRPRSNSMPTTSFDLQLAYMHRVHAELLHLVAEEESIRSSVAGVTRALVHRRLDDASRQAEEPTVEIGRSRRSESTGSHDASQGLGGAGLPVLSNVLCSICRSSCYLSYADCTCTHATRGEVMCLRHPDSLCRCGRAVITFRFAIDELTDIRDRVAEIIEHQTKQQRRERRRTTDQARKAAAAETARSRSLERLTTTSGTHAHCDAPSGGPAAAASPMVKVESSDSLLPTSPFLLPHACGVPLRISTPPTALSPTLDSRGPSPTPSLQTHVANSPRITMRPPMLHIADTPLVAACCSPSSVASPISKRSRHSDTGTPPPPLALGLAHDASPPPLGLIQTPPPASMRVDASYPLQAYLQTSRTVLPSPFGYLSESFDASTVTMRRVGTTTIDDARSTIGTESSHLAHLLPPLIDYDAALRANQAQIDALQTKIDETQARFNHWQRQQQDLMQSQAACWRPQTNTTTTSMSVPGGGGGRRLSTVAPPAEPSQFNGAHALHTWGMHDTTRTFTAYEPSHQAHADHQHTHPLTWQ